MDIMTLNPVEDIISATLTESAEFKQFCRDLDSIDILWDNELHLEAVQYARKGARREIAQIFKNTKDTTRDVGVAFHNITDANAGLIKNTWDLVMGCVKLMTRSIGFIVRHVSNIPLFILKVANKTMDIPNDIRNKIRGNIKLYININDIQDLYNQSLLLHIRNIISLGREISEGDFWGKFGKKREGDNDMKIGRKIAWEYKFIEKLNFTQDIIDMKSKQNVDTYFGGAKSVKFKDINGIQHEETYYEALATLLKDIKGVESELKDVDDAISKKFTATQANQTFAQMGASSQRRVTETMQYISKAVKLIGDIIRYISIDIKTIESASNAILKKSGIKAGNEEKVKSTAN